MVAPSGHHHVGVLGEEERRRALVIAHLADVLEIIAADAPDAANGKRLSDSPATGIEACGAAGMTKDVAFMKGISAGYGLKIEGSFTRLR